jgi:nucleoside-diphosphate-sugar epimerase
VALRELVGRVGRLLDAEELVDFGAIEPPPTDLPFVVADAGQLRGLGWAPRLDHDQGIADTVAWWRERVKSRTA